MTIKPVMNLADAVNVNAYEHPARIRERIHLRHPVDTFPHASRKTRAVDLDHVRPYDKDGPPGQTNDTTSRPLSRTPHRAKTHLGYQVTALPTGEVIWRTPHGLIRIVDHTGTYAMNPEDAEAWTNGTPLDLALIGSSTNYVVPADSGQLASPKRP